MNGLKVKAFALSDKSFLNISKQVGGEERETDTPKQAKQKRTEEIPCSEPP